MSRYIYVDKNSNVLTEGELAAFEILHPEEKGKYYRKILLCGICYSEVSRKTNRVLKGKAQTKSSPQNTSSYGKAEHYYVCPFCKTPNEPLRNTCKKCDRILFSTEYETKRISASSFKASSRNKRRSESFDMKKIFIPLVVILAIAFLATRGTETGPIGVSSNQVIPSNVSGQSTYEWKDGTKYTGDFKGGQPHGKGTIVWTTGQTYTGDFLHGQMTGYGTFKFIDGTIYTGNLHNGKPHGQGTMQYSNGSVYTGNWVNGERE